MLTVIVVGVSKKYVFYTTMVFSKTFFLDLTISIKLELSQIFKC